MTEEVDETKALATVFVAAAELLTGQQEPACRGEEARALLAALDYPPGDREAAADRAALLRAAARFARIFQLRAPEAPGLVFFGCEADQARIGSLPAEHAIAGLSGTGL